MENKTILIAEDDEMSYRVLEGFLRKLPYSVHRVSNGWDAFVYCIENEVHLVLMDMKMAILDGFQATVLIKKYRPDTIVVAQTALTMDGDEELCRNAGCDDYISKPINYYQFIEIIKFHMSTKANSLIR